VDKLQRKENTITLLLSQNRADKYSFSEIDLLECFGKWSWNWSTQVIIRQIPEKYLQNIYKHRFIYV